jgi:hypothetical protein
LDTAKRLAAMPAFFAFNQVSKFVWKNITQPHFKFAQYDFQLA